MINRELIRLRIVQLTYAYYQGDGKPMDVAEKELMFSFDKAYELYLYLLSVLVKVHRLAIHKNEARIARMTRQGNNPNGIFPEKMLAENKFLIQLNENETLIAYMEKKKEWIEEEAFIKKLYTTFTESSIYELYLTKEEFDYEADREVVRKLYKTFVQGNEDFDNLIEDHCIYWNDDKFLIDSFVLKTIKRFTPESTPAQELLPKFSSDEDSEFAIQLFRAVIARADETREIIRANARNWDLSRMAYMDVIIMQIALAEILEFPSIPLSVSINEYLDIAKVYSTPRSASYINGLLDNAVTKLRAEGIILKERSAK